jgi:simple sugar transport system permease protein
MPLWRSWGVRAIAILLALIINAVIIYAVVKMNPLTVYEAMFEGAFGTAKRMWVTIRDTMMLLCIGVGLAPAFKMRFWNIGAEGQILVGGITAAACMMYLPATGIPSGLALVIMAAGSILAGAVWGVVPAFFRARWNTNETLFTLMMNYVAIQLTSYFVALWEKPYGSNSVGIINQKGNFGWFPALFGQTYALNVIIVLAITLGMYLYLRYTKHGYEIAVVGESENTARYVAINVKKVILRTMLLSGAICGLAGFIAVSGASHTISTSTAGGQGFVAIIVAWLSGFNAFAMMLVSALLVFLEKGAIEIASRYNLSDYVSEMLTGIILFFILGSEFFINFKLKFRSLAEKRTAARTRKGEDNA